MKSALRSFLTFILLVVPAFGQTVTPRASATWDVQKYDLDVTLPRDNARSVAVTAVLKLKNVSASSAGTLTLRISPMAEVSSFKIDDAAIEFSKNEEKINASSSLQRIGVRLAPVPPNGSLTVTVAYKLNLKDNSALASASSLGAQLLPLSYWYPTPNSWFFTGGADTAPMRSKVNAPGLTVVSSGNESAGSFDQRLAGQPFFIAGRWEKTDQNGVAVYMPVGTGADGLKRAGELAALYNEAIAFAAEMLGKAPDVPRRMVAGRRGAGFGSGGTVIVDEAVFRRSRLDALTATQIAEAAAKLWLGSAVIVRGEGYGTITEGLSRYIATQFIESKFGKETADVERMRQRNAYASVSGRDAPMSAASPLDDHYYPEVANKGAMSWRILAKRVGPSTFADILRAGAEDGRLDLAELRNAFSSHKELFNYLFDEVTDTNLMVGLPQTSGGGTKVALRNTGSTDVTVEVVATTTAGERLPATATIKAASFGEITFRSTAKIERVEIDTDKLYPQTEYSDDIAPRESTDSDPLLTVKRLFDKKDFANAERTATVLLRDLKKFDELRILLGRSLLEQNKNAAAEREFRAVMDETLPTARSLAWATVGLAEVAARSNQNDKAVKLAETAILYDSEYGASLAARKLRERIATSPSIDPTIKSFFADFDRAASSNRKAEVDILVMPGEINRFAGGVSGSTEQWQTTVRQIDRIDSNTVLVETDLNLKLLNTPAESRLAVFRLTKAGGAWKMSAVEMFELK